MPLGLAAATLIGAAVQAVGSYFQNRENRAFAEEQGANQYQRMVRDMNRAGLNPMLAYSQGHGEQTPGYAGQNPLEGAGSTALQYKLARETVETQRSIQASNYASAAKQIQETDFSKFQLDRERLRWDTESKVVGAEILMEYERKQAELNSAKTSAERAGIQKEIDQLQARLTRLMVPQAEFGSEQYKYIERLDSPEWMKYIGGFLLKGAGTASQIYRNVSP